MTSQVAKWQDIDKDLVLAFFFEFSRFEYALKRAGFVQKNIIEAKPDWDSFANAIAQQWSSIRGEAFESACKYFIARPPAKQVVVDNALGWEAATRKGESDAGFVIRCVRRVRNNLFHGGKFPTGPVTDPERDTALLESALAVLRGALTIHADVRGFFVPGS